MRKKRSYGRLRIIGGRFKGRYISSMLLPGLRPTANMVRESLFNIIGTRIEGAIFYDLFAGTGSVGIEALSRGAKSVCFVEENRACSELLYENINLLSLADEASLVTGDAVRFLKKLDSSISGESEDFNIIFADPPYSTDLLNQVLSVLEVSSLIKNGMLIMEHSYKHDLNMPFNDVSRYRYGDTRLTVSANCQI